MAGWSRHPKLIMAYLARPESMPPEDACAAERDLHASLLADPLRAVSKADIAVLADPDARENWTFMVNFRDRLVAAPSLEAEYVNLAPVTAPVICRRALLSRSSAI